ncbi:ACT domain-containing protein [Maritalea porphyrae]|uniref:ACT domain-containing protein n=1 Tax=Maritalea porphyrae TaxID=880732 RepID=UPI0022AEFB28|nr:ACT domain-containing protein [Maritalea porphyrae]MCZ4271579.1 ACT domain-containing protein [Maritalea porphyrae]
MTSSIAKTDITDLLKHMDPQLDAQRYAFATVGPYVAAGLDVVPTMSFIENEGVTLILCEEDAIKANIAHEFICQKITLQVHSALEAVGFMAAISNKLLDVGVPCNVVAGFYHDHLFIPVDKVETAMAALKELAG